MQRLLLLLAMLVFTTGCSRDGGYEKRSSRVVNNYSRLAQKKHRLQLRDVKWDYSKDGMEGLHHVEVDYYAYQLMEIEDARLAVVETAEGLLRSINMDNELRPHIIEYPMTIENLTMRIEIEHFFGQYFEPIYIGYVMLEDGNISYYSYEKELLVREPYDKAEQELADKEAEVLQRATQQNIL